MRKLINEANIENVVKFYGYIERYKSFRNKKVYQLDGCDELDYNFGQNLDLWESNKAHLFKLMGGRLKITKELTDTNLCSDTVIRSLIQQFLRDNKDELHVLIKLLLANLSPSEIANNRLERAMNVLDVKLPEGSKVTKCFSLLELNKERLDRQQSLYSIFLQSLYIRGRLVLSIDPLDYITMSCSKSGWSSCHHPTGGYGVGSISYMNDGSSMIAYVETEDPMEATIYDGDSDQSHNLSMPNKIWRQVITVNANHEYALQMAQYPNDSKIYSGAVSELMAELLGKSTEEKYLIEDMPMCDDSGNLQYRNSYLDRYIFYCDYYNDNFRNLTAVFTDKFKDIYSMSQMADDGELTTIKVGEEVYCACGCGSTNYTGHAFVEESDYDDEEYDENYDDGDW